eukprot:133106-Amphidinium_carterae.1
MTRTVCFVAHDKPDDEDWLLCHPLQLHLKKDLSATLPLTKSTAKTPFAQADLNSPLTCLYLARKLLDADSNEEVWFWSFRRPPQQGHNKTCSERPACSGWLEW